MTAALVQLGTSTGFAASKSLCDNNFELSPQHTPMSVPVSIEGILERKVLFFWQSRKFYLRQDGSFSRYKGDALRSTSMVQPGTVVTGIGSDQFVLKGLTENGRSERDYVLRAPSTSLRNDWVSKFEERISLINTKASKPQPPSPASSAPHNNAESGQLKAHQLQPDRAVAPAVEASEPRAPSSPAPEMSLKSPASPFDLGIRASQLSMYYSSPDMPIVTRDLINHITSGENKLLGGSTLQRGGGFAGTPTIIVCHSHDAVWKETIDAVCTFCSSLKDGLDTVVWIDVLCIDHAQVGALNDAAAIQAAISRIDCVLMVSSPWHSPLTLAWPPSLWMAYCALAGPSKKLSIVLTESEHSLFASTVSDHVPFIRYLAQFSCRNLLYAPSAASFKHAIEHAGVNAVDECIVDAMDKWFVSALEAAVAAADAQKDDKRKVRTQQVLARLMLDTERYDSSGWKILDKSKSEGGTNQTDAAVVPAPDNENAARAKVAAAAEAQAIQESKFSLEVELLSAIAANLAAAIAAGRASEGALTHSTQCVKDETKASQSQAPATRVAAVPSRASPAAAAAAPTATRKAALSLSFQSAAPNATLSVASVLSVVEDDSAFDETVTPDAPVLKYGRNGVPELRQLFLSDDKRFLIWKSKKGGQGSVDVFQLNDILLGQQTETFKLLPTAGLAVVSFSLLFDDRTLDVVVKSVRERLWWVAHILYLHKMLRPHATKSIAESLRTQLQGGNFEKLNETSKTQLHALFIELMNGREEEKIRNRRKHAALVKYRSVLDFEDLSSSDPRLVAPRAFVNALKALASREAVTFLDACAAVSPDLQGIGRFCVTMIQEQIKLFTMVYLEGKELADDRVISCLEGMTDARDKVLASDEESSDRLALRSHFIMLSSAAPAFCWVCHPGLPAELLTDVLNALPVFGQRLEALGPEHVEFFNALKSVLRVLLQIMHQYHADGVAWTAETVTCTIVTGRFRSQTDSNKIFQTDVDFVGIHVAFVAGPVERLVQASKVFGEYLQKQVLLCKLAFIEQKNIVTLSRQHLPPRTHAHWGKVLHNINLLQASIEDMADEADARSESQDSILALRLITGAMGCVSWLTIDLNPHLFLTDVLSGLSVYGDKLLALDDGSGRCSDFVGAAVDLVGDLATLVKTYHSHGLVWNPKGEELFVEADAGEATE